MIARSVLAGCMLLLVAELLIGQSVPAKCGLSRSLLRGGASGMPLMDAGRTVADRPITHTSIVSPAGAFRLHYDTSGQHTPALLDGSGVRIPGTYHAFAESAAVAFDRSRSALVNVLGYEPGPPDPDGGDDRYDVYLQDLPADLFGETVLAPTPFQSSPNARYLTWIQVDNDFAGLRTPGLSGLKITAAHEYFHAIQFASYGIWNSGELYWYELTAVWAEEAVYPGVDDYLFNVPAYFSFYRTTSLSHVSSTFPGYERSLFAHFLSERYGTASLRRTWENVRTHRVLDAVRLALAEAGSSVRRAYREFGIWNLHTGERADTVRFYRHGRKFPLWTPLATTSVGTGAAEVRYDFSPLSQGVFFFRTGGDTIVALVTNVELEQAVAAPSAQRSSRVVVSRNTVGLPSQLLTSGVRGSFETSDPAAWDVEYIGFPGGSVIPRTALGVAPNPWVLASGSECMVPVEAPAGSFVSVTLIAPSFVAHALGDVPVTSAHGAAAVYLSPSMLAGDVGSGTYVLHMRSAAGSTMTKLTIIR